MRLTFSSLQMSTIYLLQRRNRNQILSHTAFEAKAMAPEMMKNLVNHYGNLREVVITAPAA